MASVLNDLISKAVASQVGGINIPANLKESVLGGLSESVLGGLTQTAATAGGLDQIKNLLTGKSAAAAGPIATIASKIFTKNTASKLSLPAILTSSITGIIPAIVGKLSGVLKDQDGDGDVDLQDVLIALKGGGAQQKNGGILGSAAGSILGSILKKK